MSEVRIRRGDGFDAAELADTMRSLGFRRIQARLLAQRDQCVKALIAAKSWDEALRLQGQIEAIERSIAVPDILRQEDNQRKTK